MKTMKLGLTGREVPLQFGQVLTESLPVEPLGLKSLWLVSYNRLCNCPTGGHKVTLVLWMSRN